MSNCAIVIPAFNAAAFLAEAIESALAQTVAAAAIVVVDDGSTDATPEIVNHYDSGVRSLRQENAGVSAARNTGAAAVSAEWVLFLDADDRLVPDAMERLLSRAATSGFGVVYGQTIYFDESGARRIHGTAAAEGRVPYAARANFWKSVAATPGAAIIRTTLLQSVGGFSSDFDTAADRDLWMRAGTQAEFAFVEMPVIEKRQHATNMSGDASAARIQAVQVQFQFLAWCRDRGIDTAFLETSPTEIIERNLERALQTRSFAAAAWICQEAARCGIRSTPVDRARRLVAASPLGREIELKLRELLKR